MTANFETNLINLNLLVSKHVKRKGVNVNPMGTLLQNFEAALYTVKRLYERLGLVTNRCRFGVKTQCVWAIPHTGFGLFQIDIRGVCMTNSSEDV